MTNDKKTYKVIAIPDDKTLIIDYGRKDQASKKDIVNVIEKGPEIIYDNKSYGTFDNIKAELKINEIYNEFSVCSNRYTTSVNASLKYFTDVAQNMGSLMRTVDAKLNVNEEEIKNLEKPKDSPISLGDMVEIIKF